MIIKRITPTSFAKVLGTIHAGIGFIIGAIFAIIMALGGPELAPMAIVALIGIPLFYGVMGGVSGYIGAWLYNFAADKVGGVDIEVG